MEIKAVLCCAKRKPYIRTSRQPVSAGRCGFMDLLPVLGAEEGLILPDEACASLMRN